MSTEAIVITGAARTGIGELGGQFASVPAPALGAAAVQAAVARSAVSPELIEEVVMGCVLAAGLGQAPARQAALGAQLPAHVPCTTINKMCGSGMKAVMMAAESILAGNASVAIGGGFENMSRAPYLLDKARSGYRMGHGALYDHMFLDGLEDAYEPGTLMGVYADRTAQRYEISRQDQDDFALRSLSCAQKAIEAGAFKAEIAPVNVTVKKKTESVEQDELPLHARPEKIPTLRPAFGKDGTVTAANASGISDGASALVLSSASAARRHGLPVLGKIVAMSSVADAPEWFTTAPIAAIEKVMKKAGWSTSDVDLFEINEAFAVVTLAAIRTLSLPIEKVNIRGGACALGHPIGASGARIITTLLYAMQATEARRGIATLCIGGGEATAIAIEREIP